MKKTMKRIIAFILSMVMILTTLVGCGKSEEQKKEVDTSGYLTRGEWVSMLSKTFGFDEYEQETPYYEDVTESDEIYESVQSCRERNLLSVDTKNFNSNEIATLGFVASTAVLAAGIDYTKYAEGTNSENEAIIKCARETGICPEADNDEKVLRQGVSEVYASVVLNAAQGLFLAYAGEEKYEVSYAEGVIDNFENESVKIDADGNLTMDTAAQIGSIIVCPPSEEYPNGHAVKVTRVDYEPDGTPVYVTEEAEFAEVFEDVDIATIVEATPDCFYPVEGVTIISEDSVDADNTAVIGDVECEYIDTEVNSEAQKTVTLDGNFSKSNETTLKIDLKKGTVKPSTKTTDDLSLFGGRLDLKKEFEDKYSLDDKKKKKLWDDSAELNSLASKRADKIIEKYKNGEMSFDDFKKKMQKFHNENGIEKGLTAKGNFDAGWNLTGTVKINMSVAAAAAVSVKWFLKTKLESFSIDITNKFETSLTLEGKFEGEVEIGKYKIPVGATGASVDIAVFLKVEGNGKITLKTVVTNSQKIEYKDGKTTKTNKSTSNCDLEIELTLKVSAGLKVSICLLTFDIVDASISASIKLEIKGKAGRDITLEESVSDDGTSCLKYEDALVLRHEESIMAPIVELTVGSNKSMAGKLGLSFTIKFITEDDIKKSGSPFLYKHNEKEIKFLIDSEIIEIGEQPTTEEETTEAETSTELELITEEYTGKVGVLALNDFAISIKPGNQYQLKVIRLPDGYEDSDIIWSVEDTSIATISQKGIVNTVKSGSTKAYAKTKDGKYLGSCNILVR